MTTGPSHDSDPARSRSELIEWYRYRLDSEGEAFRLHFPDTPTAVSFLNSALRRFLPRRQLIALDVAKAVVLLLILDAVFEGYGGHAVAGLVAAVSAYLLYKVTVAVWFVYAMWIVMVDRSTFEAARSRGWCHIEQLENPEEEPCS